MPTTEAPTTPTATDTAPVTAQDRKEVGDLLSRFYGNARTMRDFTELTPESMEVIYKLAYNFYNAGKYDEAEQIFRLLANLDHFERKYWKGLGASREGLQKFEDALQVYGYLGMMDIHDPYPALQAAKCFIALGKTAEAVSGLRAAAFNSKDLPEHAELHEQATALLSVAEENAKSAATA
jgi:secretion system chaperone SscA